MRICYLVSLCIILAILNLLLIYSLYIGNVVRYRHPRVSDIPSLMNTFGTIEGLQFEVDATTNQLSEKIENQEL